METEKQNDFEVQSFELNNEYRSTNSYTSTYLKENTKIGGWLSFFLFCVVAGGLVSVIFAYINFSSRTNNSNMFFDLGDLLFAIMIFALACYTVYAFIERKPNAVFLARLYLIVIFASNLLIALVGEYEESGIGSSYQVLRSLIWSGVWFAFILLSNNVKQEWF